MARRRGRREAGAVSLQEYAQGKFSGKHRAAVTRLKVEIQKELKCGYTWKVIHEYFTARGDIEMSYKTFLKHCRDLGVDRPENNQDVSSLGATGIEEASAGESRGRLRRFAAIRREED